MSSGEFPGAHPAGVQVRCVPCAGSGVVRFGLPWRFAGDSTPRCVPCWRAEQQRRVRRDRERLRAQLWEGLGAAEQAALCPVCETAAQRPPADFTSSPAGEEGSAAAPRRPGAGRVGCWRCGDAVWLRQAAEDAVRDRASRAARDVVCVAARRQVAVAAGWADRVGRVLREFARGGGRGRAVELLADLLAREVTARVAQRGRPGALGLVAAVLAVDSDWRSGRRALPGRARTARLVGCSERAVSSAWARAEQLGWACRTRQGGRLSLVDRTAARRGNDRAQFDLAPLHLGDAELRQRYVTAAIKVLGVLLGRAEDELRCAREALAAAVRAAEFSPTAPDEAAPQTPPGVRRGHLGSPSFFTPHMVSTGRDLTSCPYWGLQFSRRKLINSPDAAGLPNTGRGTDGAERPSPTTRRSGIGTPQGRPTPPPLKHPRTIYTTRSTPKRTRLRRDWKGWAPELAEQLAEQWPWLRQPGTPWPWVIATLGSRLGPDWTAPALVRYIRRRSNRAVLAAPDYPVAYLRHLLETALTGDREPPHPARRHTEHQRAVARTAAETTAAATAARRAEFLARDRDAVPAHRSSAASQLAALRAHLSQRHTSTGKVPAGKNTAEPTMPVLQTPTL